MHCKLEKERCQPGIATGATGASLALPGADWTSSARSWRTKRTPGAKLFSKIIIGQGRIKPLSTFRHLANLNIAARESKHVNMV